MRKLLLFTIGFAGVTFAAGYLQLWLCLPLTILFVLLAALAGLFRLRAKVLAAAALILLGGAAGFLRAQFHVADHLDGVRRLDGQERYVTVTVTDYSKRSDYGVNTEGKLSVDGQKIACRIYLSEYMQLYPGYTVSGHMRLFSTLPDGSKEAAKHSANGIYLLVYHGEDTVICTGNHDLPQYFAVNLRQKILQTIYDVFPEDTEAFAGALLLGESDHLSYEEESAYRISGIRHVVAVSGLHVSILFSVVYVFSRKNRFLTPLLGIPVLFLFAAVAGFTPSVVRACVMQTLMLFALLFKREYDPPTALAFAVLVILMVDPMSVYSVGLQLSVASCAGILAFSNKIYTRLIGGRLNKHILGKSMKARILRWILGSIAVTVSATFTTVPLCAIYFGAVSLVGIVTNLMTMWMVSFVFYMIMAASAISYLCIPVAGVIAEVVSWVIRYIQMIADVLAGSPFSAVYTQSVYIVIWLAGSYALVVFAMISRRFRMKFCALAVAASLLLSIGVSWLEPSVDSLRVTVIDVGQGQSVLLMWEDKAYLVDCGGDSDVYAANTVQQTLAALGIFYLDGIIVSHYDRDHAGGIPLLLERVPAGKLYLPEMEDDGKIKDLLTQTHPDSIQWIATDTVLEDCGGLLTFFVDNTLDNENENSMSVLFQRENCDILIVGDRGTKGEAALLKRGVLPKLELLVVGHHGSNTSSSYAFLRAMEPQMAVVSTGTSSYYQRPADQVLHRFDVIGCPVFSTAVDGTITFRR